MKKLYALSLVGAFAIGGFINLTSDTLNQNHHIGPVSGTEVDGFIKRRA